MKTFDKILEDAGLEFPIEYYSLLQKTARTDKVKAYELYKILPETIQRHFVFNFANPNFILYLLFDVNK